MTEKTELDEVLEKLFGKLKFSCKCPYCGHEWIYVPRSGIPERHVTCPVCRRKVSLRLYCKLVTKPQQ